MRSSSLTLFAYWRWADAMEAAQQYARRYQTRYRVYGYRAKFGDWMYRVEPARVQLARQGLIVSTEYAAQLAAECRVVFTRSCPPTGCDGRSCARFADNDESRWTASSATGAGQ